MLEVWRIFNSPASPSVKVKLYNELLFCWGKKIKGKLLTVFGDDKRELKKLQLSHMGYDHFSVFKFPDSSRNKYMNVWCQCKLAAGESSN